MDTINLLTIILVVILGIMGILLIVLGAIYVMSKMNNKSEKTTDKGNKQAGTNGTKKYKDYKVESVMDFMEFDTVIDNMISQKNGMRYIMVVECQGINYDLMSEMEKNSVEEGFLQFLNTLRYPVQIYTQTRTVNLDSSIQTYKQKVKELQVSLEKQEMKYNEMVKAGIYTQQQLTAALFELTKQKNLYDYGKDIIYNTEKMSLNKNVLNKNYYVIVPYFVEDLGENKFDKEEQRNLAFSEVYTRAQSVIRTLNVCGVNGRVLNSNELVELLYVAYNRDEAEVYGLEKALKAGFDELYATAPDVVEKKIRTLDKQIEEEALTKAKVKVEEARSDKQKALEEKQRNKRDLIDELAELIIKENAEFIGQDIVESATNKIKEDKDNEEGGTKDNEEKPKAKRARKTTRTA